MEKISSRIKPEVLLHVINRKEDITNQRQDLSPAEEYLQVARLTISKDKTPGPHKHVQQIRTTDITQESWIVMKGMLKVILYDLDDKIIEETTLGPGDCLVTFRGGHNLIALEDDTVIYEHKTGPYQGKEKDNVSIE